MASLGERLKLLREEHNLTQEDLGKILNVKKAAISKYESDKISMNLDSIKLLAKHFRIPINYFVDETSSAFEKSIVSLPILGTIRAGLPLLAQENIRDYLELPADLDADYALQVAGDSMIGAGILNGDLAICRQTEMAQSGQIVVAITDLPTGFSEAALRYFLEGNSDGPKLGPANPQYKEWHMKDGYRIAGVMVTLIRKYTPSYPIYKDSWLVNEGEWTEVIDLANQAGLKVNQVQQILATQIEIAKNLKNLD